MNKQKDTPKRFSHNKASSQHVSRQRLSLGALVVILLAFSGYTLYWYVTRPPVVHYDNLKYIQLIRTACSARNPTHVDGVERALEDRIQQGAMTETERRAFEHIIADARSGYWQRAERSAMRLEEAQLSRRR